MGALIDLEGKKFEVVFKIVMKSDLTADVEIKNTMRKLITSGTKAFDN
jgi:hypothetical protein